ncbi:MAG: hypothetical protein QOG04_2398 [Actinomycetota bacterium]|nr:hypothetical protein [Actinomycetota bacterium]
MSVLPSRSTSIDPYLRHIADRLPGPASVRRRLLDEIQDHLSEETDALVSTGSDPAVAADRAVASFGSTDAIVEEFRRELARWSTARSALLLLAGTLAFTGLWIGILATGPNAPWTEQHEPLGLVWTDVVGTLAMVMTLIVVMLANVFYWLPIRTRSHHPVVRKGPDLAVLACRFGIRTLTCSLSSIVAYVLMRVYLAPRSLEWLDIGFGTTTSIIAIVALISMSRSLRAIPVAIRRPPREVVGPSC